MADPTASFDQLREELLERQGIWNIRDRLFQLWEVLNRATIYMEAMAPIVVANQTLPTEVKQDLNQIRQETVALKDLLQTTYSKYLGNHEFIEGTGQLPE